MKSDAMKDQARIILQHENGIQSLHSENETLRKANQALSERVTSLSLIKFVVNLKFSQINELRNELAELKSKERGLCDLLEKTEEELKSIKSSVFELFVG